MPNLPEQATTAHPLNRGPDNGGPGCDADLYSFSVHTVWLARAQSKLDDLTTLVPQDPVLLTEEKSLDCVPVSRRRGRELPGGWL